LPKTGLSTYPQDRGELLRYWHERWQKAKSDLEAAQAHFASIKMTYNRGCLELMEAMRIDALSRRRQQR
jgi:hypothetical protein